MMFQIENTEDGYIVSCYHNERWQRLRNFGDRQGDAIYFMKYDCPKLEYGQLKLLEQHFDIKKKYKRISSRLFRTQQ